MKKLLLILLCVPLLFSCGDKDIDSDNPNKNGVKAGEIECEINDLQSKHKDIQDDIDELDLYIDGDGNFTRTISNPKFFELQNEQQILYLQIMPLKNKIWNLRMDVTNTMEDRDDQLKYIEKFEEERKKYIEENCEDCECAIRDSRGNLHSGEDEIMYDDEADKNKMFDEVLTPQQRRDRIENIRNEKLKKAVEEGRVSAPIDENGEFIEEE